MFLKKLWNKFKKPSKEYIEYRQKVERDFEWFVTNLPKKIDSFDDEVLAYDFIHNLNEKLSAKEFLDLLSHVPIELAKQLTDDIHKVMSEFLENREQSLTALLETLVKRQIALENQTIIRLKNYLMQNRGEIQNLLSLYNALTKIIIEGASKNEEKF